MEICLKSSLSLLLVLLLLPIFVVAPSSSADRGMVPVEPDVSVYEPGQKAIVAWNGLEEILILSTDITADVNTSALEIMPLPSNPSVIEKASFDSFVRLQEYIWMRGPEVLGKNYRGDQTESVVVTFHEEIGAHDITVVNASDALEFTGWIEDFLKNNGISQEISLQNFRNVVEDYMARGFRFFVLDLIYVSTEENSIEPILYQFETSFLYYPLEISSPIPGDTVITLFLLTKGEVETHFYSPYYPLTLAYYRSPTKWEPIRFELTKGELAIIDLRISKLFEDKAWLTVLEYDGKTNGLIKDLMITESSIKLDADSTGSAIQLLSFGALVGVLCTLTGATFVFLITRGKQDRKRSV
jgi:hypothetical protein